MFRMDFMVSRCIWRETIQLNNLYICQMLLQEHSKLNLNSLLKTSLGGSHGPRKS